MDTKDMWIQLNFKKLCKMYEEYFTSLPPDNHELSFMTFCDRAYQEFLDGEK
jgi:hypothetical protein